MFPYGHVECSFDSIAEQGLTGGQKFSTQYHEVVVFSEKLRSKGSFGHVECSSENPGNNNLVGGQKNSPQNQKGWILLTKKIRKMFVWTRNNQFLHFCHKTFARRPKIFGSLSKKDEKHNISIKNSFPNIYPWTCIWNQFWQFRRTYFQNCMKFFAQCPDLKKKEIELEEKIPQSVPLDTWKEILTNPTLKNFIKRQKLSRSICKVEMKEILCQKQYFSWKRS